MCALPAGIGKTGIKIRFVRGACLSLALEEYGSMGWHEVTQPAIRIAEEGYDVYEPHVLNFTELLSRFPESAKTYLKPDGTPYRPGERARTVAGIR